MSSYTSMWTFTTGSSSADKRNHTKPVSTVIIVPPPTDSLLYWFPFRSTDYNATNYTFANYAPYNNGTIVSRSGSVGTSGNVTLDTSIVKVGSGSLNISNRTGTGLLIGTAITIANNSGFSYCFWYRSANGYVPTGYDRLADFTTGSNYSYICAADATGTNPNYLMVVFGTGNAFWVYIYKNIFDGNWHHIAVTNQSTGGWQIYSDNVMYNSASSLWHSQHSTTV